jgi:hypothetical protein
MPAALIEAPPQSHTLAYLDGYDAVLNGDYAFVAYRETDLSGDWRVRISGKQTPGGVFEPEAMRLQSRHAGAQGKPYFTWGWSLDPSAGDPRCIQFRVHIKDGKPAEIEIFMVLRKADGTADAPRSVKFAWPV